MTILYIKPKDWLRYDPLALVEVLTDAKAAVMALTAMPYQRAWADTLQELELKREVAGTSRIEGAEFTERELDQALGADRSDDTHFTRSQRQARAAQQTYKWIAGLPTDRPIDESLIKEIHRRIVTGCDDDHCAPGELRGRDHNVVFGRPNHRGVEGGEECRDAFSSLCRALMHEFRTHDPFVQALALHYHMGAMHPFQDGNGRTSRAVEALMLRRARLKDDLFVSMSNYYYEEKDRYLAVLAEVRAKDFDLTPFLMFGLRGIATQCQRLFEEIKSHLAKSLFRDVMARMYGRLLSTRKRALAERQMAILENLLLDEVPWELGDLWQLLYGRYHSLKAPERAFFRDLNYLVILRAINVVPTESGISSEVSIRKEWGSEITETEFYQRLNKMPEAKTKLTLRRP